MSVELEPLEARVIGCLIEKSLTTPDQYPLSLNALTTACNQKSNRDPVLSLEQTEVQDLVDALSKKYLVSDKAGFGGRVKKYKHRFCNTEFGTLQFSEQELGVVCALLLRGPQTPGELRAHTNRLCTFADVSEVDAALLSLAEHDEGPFVVQLPREPGKRESRYMHLFCGEPDIAPVASEPVPRMAEDSGDGSRIAQLEERVEELEMEIVTIKEAMGIGEAK